MSPHSRAPCPREEFERLLAEGAFLEHAFVHNAGRGNRRPGHGGGGGQGWDKGGTNTRL